MLRNRSTRLSLCLALALLGAVGGHEFAMAQDAGVPAVADKSAAGELAFWNQIKDSQNPADFKSYLLNFPDGMFVDPALRKFEQAGGQKSDLPPLVTAKDAAEDMPAKSEQVEVPVKAKAKKVVKIKTKKTAKVGQSKKKYKRIVRSKVSSKARKVAHSKSRKVRSGVGLAQPASLRCKSGRIVNGRCATVTVKKRKPTGDGANTPDSGGWGGGGGGGGGGNPGGGWGG